MGNKSKRAFKHGVVAELGMGYHGTHTGRWSSGEDIANILKLNPFGDTSNVISLGEIRIPGVQSYRVSNKRFTQLMSQAWEQEQVVPNSDLIYLEYESAIVLFVLRKHKTREIAEAVATLLMLFNKPIATAQAFQ